MDDLRWQLGARYPGADYRIFKTGFVDATHPKVSGIKRFSLIDCVDWVNVIAVTPDRQVVLIRQYRPGTDGVYLEIPGGMVDEGEDPETAAARELEEETGYVGTSIERIGRVAPNPAIQNNYLHTYLVLGAAPTSAMRLDSSEVITVETAPLADAYQMCRDGRIDHALVVAAFGHLALRGSV